MQEEQNKMVEEYETDDKNIMLLKLGRMTMLKTHKSLKLKTKSLMLGQKLSVKCLNQQNKTSGRSWKQEGETKKNKEDQVVRKSSRL